MASFARLHRLTEPREEDVGQTFRRLAELLAGSGRTSSVRCTLLVGDGRRHWSFELQGRECQLHTDPGKAPDLEIITREEIWWEIADGRLSPLEAFLRGRLRILGDTDLGSQLLRQVAEGDGMVSLCGG